jgi:dipeptidyl aminopeptidase/acylaminoacyl peptidase/CubicO group peptidase (beta-lactamase class C family)
VVTSLSSCPNQTRRIVARARVSYIVAERCSTRCHTEGDLDVTRRITIDDLYDLAVPEQPAMSPDGERIVYTLRTTDREGDRDVRALWLVPTLDGEPRRLTRGTNDRSPAWSPDGTRIAFLRADDGPAQVWLLPIDGGEAEQLTSVPLGAGRPVWSPDGSSLAFSAPFLPGSDGESSSDASKRFARMPAVSDRLGHKADGTGLLGAMRQHVHVVEIETGDVRRVTHGDWHAGEPSWSPDGGRIAFSAGRAEDADLTQSSAAWIVDVSEPNAEPASVGPLEGMLTPVAWTADGGALVAVGRQDTQVGHAGLLLLPLDGGDAVELAAGLDRNVMPGGPGYPGALPTFVDDGGAISFCVRDRGCTHLYVVDIDGGTPRCVVGGPAVNVSGATVSGGTAAVVLGTATSYGEVAAVDLATGETTVRTHHGPDSIDLFVPQEREFTLSDGTTVQGWLLRDPDRPGPAPLLLDIHGGPHNAWNGAADPVHLYHQLLVARGWTILLVNPRASDGYGEDFFAATVGQWATLDARDFLEPVDQLVAERVADPECLAVSGYSYGGFMTCYLTSLDARFAAAVTGGVVCDLASMAGSSDLGHYLADHELGGLPWKSRDDYARRSPISRVEQVTTPTLVVQGNEDERCPVAQAEQWFTALREQRVPSRLVLYPGASHLFIITGRPSHRADWNQRTVDWLEQYAVPAGQRRPAIDRQHWQQRLTELAAAHRVPGAQLGILRLGDEPVVASTGVLNKATGVEVTDDSVFQIGSISKVWTATVAVQLADEGKLDLDAPIVTVLPELQLADPDVTQRVTMRHLLTHTSGIDGDVFTDTGRGDDCLELYVDRLAEAGQNHPLGATFSYCNAGFVLAGRVIEKITGQVWDATMRERLFAPLGLTHTLTLPEEALLLRAAVGHLAEGDEEPHPTQVWGMPRALGPAGTISASAGDVLAFAQMHLAEGAAPDGTRVLDGASARAMTEHQIDLPDPYTLGDSWGVGWIRFLWGGRRVIGHDGTTLGQAAFLRILPDRELAVTLLTNGGNGHDLYLDLFREIFSELGGVEMPEQLTPGKQTAVDAGPHLGTYERAGARIEVLDGDGGLRIRQTATGAIAELMEVKTHEFDLLPVRESLFAYRAPGTKSWAPVVFYRLPTGEQYVHSGARATPRVS